MKLPKFLLAVITASFLTVGFSFAAEKDAPAAAAEAKQAKCCAKAEKDGGACEHSCCVESAAAGKNCAKCGGAGEVAAKK